MTLRTSLLALGAALALFSGPSHAADKGGPAIGEPQPVFMRAGWTGVHLGVHGGLDMTNTEVGFGPLSIDGISHSGVGYGIHVGYDHQFRGGRLVVGIGADYTWSDADFSVKAGGASLLTAGLDKSWTVTGRVGVDMGRVMPYILAGFSRADASASFLGTSIGSISMDGWVAGGGIDMKLADNVAIGAEYRYTRFDGPAFAGGALTLDPERHELRAALKYRVDLFSR